MTTATDINIVPFVTATRTSDLCPTCAEVLAVEEHQEPWCERCEWNLDAYAPPANWPWYARSIARRDHRAGFRADLRLTTIDPNASAVSRGFVFLCLVSAVLILLPLAALVTAGWLVIWHWSGPAVLAGVALLLVAYGLGPRFGRVRRHLRGNYRMDPQRAPVLHRLVDRVAEATGAPRPDIVALDLYGWNASAAVVGIRGTRILTLGLPLLASLQPQEMVALLGHELGHFANKDSRRSLLTQPARSTFGRLSAALRPPPGAAVDRGFDSLYALVYGLWRLLAGLLSWLLFGLHMAVHVVGASEDRRAEQRADLLSARAGGTAAALSLLGATAGARLYGPAVHGFSTPGYALREWRTNIAANRDRNAARISRLRQLTIRTDASLFASHPTTGRRYQFLAATPPQPAAVTLTEQDLALLVRELGPYAERLRLDLAEQYEM